MAARAIAPILDFVGQPMSTIYINSYVHESLDADVAAIISAMEDPPDGARRILIRDHVAALKNAGIWDNLDTYYMMAAHHEQASRINWKSPGNFTLATNGGVAFTEDRGWQGNGTTGYLDTGWAPATHGVNYTINDASFGVYSRTDIFTATVLIDFGAQNAGGGRTMIYTVSGNYFAELHQTDAAGRIQQPTASVGLFVPRRTASNAIQLYKNGALLGTGNSASVAMPSGSFFVGARNNNGTADSFTTRQYAVALTAAAMTTQQQADLYTIMQNGYLTDVGAAL